MGMIAEYLMIDKETLNKLTNLDNEDLTNEIFEIEESQKFSFFDIDKIWDALHCFLTGVSASEPIEDDKLSEAIVGIHTFIEEDDDADFISYTKNEELAEIIKVLENIDFESLSASFDPIILKKKKIYPSGIWKENKESLLEEFKDALGEILSFYKQALKDEHHVVVSIL
ncbi:YfbM family protein [Flavobacterium sp.]|uniref:YfbM family protein n=1 Tax=Flavobacterium sp. TaxID=239 RepID=UPI0031D13A95